MAKKRHGEIDLRVMLEGEGARGEAPDLLFNQTGIRKFPR